jgi:hypothetical protein
MKFKIRKVLSFAAIFSLFFGILIVDKSPAQAACISTSLGNSSCNFTGISFNFGSDIGSVSFWDFTNTTGQTAYDLHIQITDQFPPGNFQVIDEDILPSSFVGTNLTTFTNRNRLSRNTGVNGSFIVTDAYWTNESHSRITSVPEPLNIIGTATALCFVLAIKRQHSKKFQKGGK